MLRRECSGGGGGAKERVLRMGCSGRGAQEGVLRRRGRASRQADKQASKQAASKQASTRKAFSRSHALEGLVMLFGCNITSFWFS